MELKTIRIQRVVEQQNLASVMKSGSLDVLATPQMIAWMEEAACLCLDLEEGKTRLFHKKILVFLKTLCYTTIMTVIVSLNEKIQGLDYRKQAQG